MKTYVTKPADVVRKWYVIDAENKVLGRLAAEVATILRGKKKPSYQPNVDTGDYVIIVNAGKVALSGFKEDKKEYFFMSQQPGHSKTTKLKDVLAKHPERVVEWAVKGMLPHNSLGRAMYRKLHVYASSDHRHQAQKPEPLEV